MVRRGSAGTRRTRGGVARSAERWRARLTQPWLVALQRAARAAMASKTKKNFYADAKQRAMKERHDARGYVTGLLRRRQACWSRGCAASFYQDGRTRAVLNHHKIWRLIPCSAGWQRWAALAQIFQPEAAGVPPDKPRRNGAASQPATTGAGGADRARWRQIWTL